MQILLAGIVLIIGFPVAIQLLLAMLANPLVAVLVVPAGLYVISR